MTMITEYSLTERQLECLKMFAEGETLKGIARNLQLRANTIEGHFAKIRVALDARTSAHAVTIAMRVGLLK
jgi:DNA-binding CsgD family transcriptional regulator